MSNERTLSDRDAARSRWSRSSRSSAGCRLPARWFGRDLIAGVIIVCLLVPEGMAYAQIAGMPPETAFYIAPPALLLYAIFASSHKLVVVVSATQAALSAAAIARSPPLGRRLRRLTAALALLVGVITVTRRAPAARGDRPVLLAVGPGRLRQRPCARHRHQAGAEDPRASSPAKATSGSDSTTSSFILARPDIHDPDRRTDRYRRHGRRGALRAPRSGRAPRPRRRNRPDLARSIWPTRGVEVIEEIPAGSWCRHVPDVTLHRALAPGGLSLRHLPGQLRRSQRVAREFARGTEARSTPTGSCRSRRRQRRRRALPGLHHRREPLQVRRGRRAGMQTQMAGLVAAGGTILVALFLTGLFGACRKPHSAASSSSR